jgi:hypothetical protein
MGRKRDAGGWGRRLIAALAVVALSSTLAGPAIASADCPAERREPQAPANLGLCALLETAIRQPRALPLDLYEAKLGEYLSRQSRNQTGG